MVRQDFDPSPFLDCAVKYSQTTREEEIIYGNAIRKVVDSNPGIIAATNIVLLDEIVPERYKKLLGVEQMKFEKIEELEMMKEVARSYLEPFNNPWENREGVEYWLEKRDEKTWKSFSEIEKYDSCIIFIDDLSYLFRFNDFCAEEETSEVKQKIMKITDIVKTSKKKMHLFITANHNG